MAKDAGNIKTLVRNMAVQGICPFLGNYAVSVIDSIDRCATSSAGPLKLFKRLHRRRL